MFGVVVRLKQIEGYGFIRGTETGSGDHFFHKSDLQNGSWHDVQLGTEVEFEPHETERGLRASEVYLR
jgi:cold shock CspA family protein